MQHYYFTISFGHKALVCEHSLIRRAIPFCVPEPFNVHGYLRFPRVVFKNDHTETPEVKFKHPIPWEKVGVERDSSAWGSVSYRSINSQKYEPIFDIKAITLDVLSNEHLTQEQIQNLKLYLTAAVDRAIGVISIKSPEYIFSAQSASTYNYVGQCEVSYLQANGRNMVDIGCTIYIHGGNPVPFSLIRELVLNAGKNHTLQYELLFQLKENLLSGDYRSCVLHAATIFETVLSKKLNDYFELHSVPNELRECVTKRMNGYSSYNDFVKKGIIDKCECAMVEETAKLRNKVIHEGRSVTKEEAEKAFKAACTFLDFHNWKIFEEQ